MANGCQCFRVLFALAICDLELSELPLCKRSWNLKDLVECCKTKLASKIWEKITLIN